MRAYKHPQNHACIRMQGKYADAFASSCILISSHWWTWTLLFTDPPAPMVSYVNFSGSQVLEAKGGLFVLPSSAQTKSNKGAHAAPCCTLGGSHLLQPTWCSWLPAPLRLQAPHCCQLHSNKFQPRLATMGTRSVWAAPKQCQPWMNKPRLIN